jgi:hypothetical protein
MRSLRNPDRKPTHPGAVLREDVLPEQALDIWAVETKFKNNPALAPKVFASTA